MLKQEKRLEELRKVLRAENISYGELLQLQDLAMFIKPDDVELLEAAGVPEGQTAFTWFEVKTGKNKGFYIVAKKEAEGWENHSDQYKRLAQTYGMLVADYNYNFYKYHNVNRQTEVIWTHSHFAGHEFNRKVWSELIDDLKSL